MTTPLAKLRWSLAHRGLRVTLQAVASSVGRRLQPQQAFAPHPFDAEHGTDTGGLITGADLASGHANDRFIEGYAAVPPSRFRNILARWQASEPPHPLAAYTFVDLGCGKGRAVLLASEFGFRETIGVELNPSLAEIARANADRWLADGKAQCPVRIDQADAAEFLWPATPCVVFLFNPFGAEVMRSVVHSLSEAFRDSPDDLEVLYYKPEQGRTFEEKFVTVWCDEVALSAADLASDPVADPHDQTCAYRLRKAAK